MASNRYTEEDVRQAALTSASMGELLRSLGLRSVGGNYANMRRKLAQLGVDTSHWICDHTTTASKEIKWEEYKTTSGLKIRLVSERGHMCEVCGNSWWLEEKIPLELHHVDGNRVNNLPDNLQLLCPNCHAMTDTWRGRNK